ncbi:MAG: class I SAM-dependent methyltransferase [Chloroflexi bacterium]|nr:class I SAM-dependent methyltransferase [Chloroflexota bacterium]
MIATSRNYEKYTNPSPLQRWFMARFLRRVAALVAESLPALVSPEPARVLDVGCGEGFVIDFLRPCFPNLSFYGIDASLLALAGAHRREVPLLQSDATFLPFLSQSFDLVLCLEVLEHLPAFELALEELKRVSTGHILLSVPNQPLFAIANLLRGKNWGTGGDDPEHVHHWRGRRFVALVRERLAVRRVVYSFPWVLVLADHSVESKGLAPMAAKGGVV